LLLFVSPKVDKRFGSSAFFGGSCFASPDELKSKRLAVLSSHIPPDLPTGFYGWALFAAG